MNELESIAHILSPMSAGWVGWTMFALLLFVVLGEWFQPGVITQAVGSLVAHNDRMYKESPTNPQGQLFITLFRIGTLGLALYLSVYTGGVFAFGVYSAICGAVLIILLIKMLCNVLLDYTFSLPTHSVAAYEHYANIASLAAVVLYAAELVLLRLCDRNVSLWVAGIISLLFVLMWMYRSWRLFVHTPRAVLYLLIYISTLEVLPLVILYFISDKLISIL